MSQETKFLRKLSGNHEGSSQDTQPPAGNTRKAKDGSVKTPAPAGPEFIGTGTFVRHDRVEDPSRSDKYAKCLVGVLVFEHCVMIDYLTQKTKVRRELFIGPDRVRAGVSMVPGRRYRLEVMRDGDRIEVVAGIAPEQPEYIGASERQVAAMNERRAKAANKTRSYAASDENGEITRLRRANLIGRAKDEIDRLQRELAPGGLLSDEPEPKKRRQKLGWSDCGVNTRGF